MTKPSHRAWLVAYLAALLLGDDLWRLLDLPTSPEVMLAVGVVFCAGGGLLAWRMAMHAHKVTLLEQGPANG